MPHGGRLPSASSDGRDVDHGTARMLTVGVNTHATGGFSLVEIE